MNLFVTGGTGFIGSYFLQAAINAGHRVKALRSSKESGTRISLAEEPEWITGTLQSIHEHDFASIDTVVHLAATGASPKMATWSSLADVNVHGSIQLMESCLRAGVKRFVAAGTCHEYGASANRHGKLCPHAALEPLSPYGASKAAGFVMMHAMAKTEPIEFFYGRIFTAYGEGQSCSNFWPSLKKAASEGRDFRMTSGRQISDFIHAEEVAEHFLTACRRQDIKKKSPLVVNIGSGQTMSLLQFAQNEWPKLGGSGSIIAGAIPDRPNQVYRYIPDLAGLVPKPSHH